MNQNTRIELNDTPISAVAKLSEGNPGALSVCMQMLQRGGDIDPDGILGGLGCILCLDSYAIYGTRIWMLYKDVCGEDLMKTVAMLRAVQLGFLKEAKLHHAVNNYGDGIDVDALLVEVQEFLPKFGKSQDVKER